MEQGVDMGSDIDHSKALEYMRQLGILGMTDISSEIAPSARSFLESNPSYYDALEILATKTEKPELEKARGIIDRVNQNRGESALSRERESLEQRLNSIESRIMQTPDDKRETEEYGSLYSQQNKLLKELKGATEKERRYNGSVQIFLHRTFDVLAEKISKEKIPEAPPEIPALPGREKEPGLEKVAAVQETPLKEAESDVLEIFKPETPTSPTYKLAGEGIFSKIISKMNYSSGAFKWVAAGFLAVTVAAYGSILFRYKGANEGYNAKPTTVAASVPSPEQYTAPTAATTPIPTPEPTESPALVPSPSPTPTLTKEDLEGIIIKELDSAPKEASQISEQIYKYMDISPKSEYNRHAETKIPFKVEKSWLTTNNFSESEVKLTKVIDGKLVELPTNKTGEDSEHIYYEAVTPGFSTFAITGKPQPTPIPMPSESYAEKEKQQTETIRIRVKKGDHFSKIARVILGYENKGQFTHEELKSLNGLVTTLHKNNPYNRTNMNYVPEGAIMTISLEGYAGVEAKLASRLVESPSQTLEARMEAKQETGAKKTIESKVREKKGQRIIDEWKKESANEPCYSNRSIEEIRRMKMKPLCSYFNVNDYKNMNVYGNSNEKIQAGWDAYRSSGDVSALQNAIQDSLGVFYRGRDSRLRRRTEIEGKPGKFKDVYFKQEQARGIADALEANIKYYFETSAEVRGSTLVPGPKQDAGLLYDGNSALSTLHVLRAQKGL